MEKINSYLGMGVIVGLVLVSLSLFGINSTFLLTLPVIFASYFALAYDQNNTVRLLCISFLCSCFVLIPILTWTSDITAYFTLNNRYFIFLMFLSIFIVNAFNYAFHLDSTFRIKYHSIFYAATNSMAILFIALVFVLLTKGLIVFAAIAYESLRYEQAWHFLITNQYFNIMLTSVVYFWGLGFAKQLIDITDKVIRSIIYKIGYYILPLLAIVGITYTVLYAYNVFYLPLITMRTVMILQGLLLMGIFFFNIVAQDHLKFEYPRITRILVKVYLFTLMPISFILYYQYSGMVWAYTSATLLWVALLLYSFCYAVSVLAEEESSLSFAQKGNVLIAIMIVLGYWIIYNPVYPLYWSQLPQPVAADKLYNLMTVVKPELQPISALDLSKFWSDTLPSYEGGETPLNAYNLRWKKSPVENDAANPVFCRVFVEKLGWQQGIIENNYCIITYEGLAYYSYAFEYLQGDPDALSYQTTHLLRLSLKMGTGWVDTEKQYKPQNACLASYQQQPGRVTNRSSFYQTPSCLSYIRAGNYLSPTIRYKVLSINYQKYREELDELVTSTFSGGLEFVPASDKDIFVIGKKDHHTIGVCQSVDKSGNLLGVLNQNRCFLIVGDQIVEAKNYLVLSSIFMDQLHWKQMSSYDFLQPETFKSLNFIPILGYQFNHSEIEYLSVCKVVHGEKTLLGVYNFSDKCTYFENGYLNTVRDSFYVLN